jgi:hypothetical protein
LDTPIPNDDIEFLKRNSGKVYIAKDENGLYYDYIQNLQNFQNDKPPF